MTSLTPILQQLRELLASESEPARLCAGLVDGLARLEQELPCCCTLPDEAGDVYRAARAARAALVRYQCLVALIDGIPADEEMNELDDQFAQIVAELGDLPVRREVVDEFERRRSSARRESKSNGVAA